jgi:hypothetical protein
MHRLRAGFVSPASSAQSAVSSGVSSSRALSGDRAESARAQGRALWLAVAGVWARAGRPLRVAAAGVCTLLLLGGSVPAHAQSVSFGGWTQQSPATSPPARAYAAMAYDASAGQLVLLGGEGNSSLLADTWTWNGTNWTQQSPATSPPARFGAAMAYDASTGQLVLFGGDSSSGRLADTWTWNGTNWTQQSPATSPPARGYAAMAYDASTGQLVLFGGIVVVVSWPTLGPGTGRTGRNSHQP